MIFLSPWLPAVVIAAVAGWTDWKSRRIPNWLTVSGALAGLAINASLQGWKGLQFALLGALLGLTLLLPLVAIRALGAGDWKLVGALGACLAPALLVKVLIASVFTAGLIALAQVIRSGRLRQTLLNVVRIFAALVTFHLPPQEFSLDNPQATKIPFGVAVAVGVFLCALAGAGSQL